MIFELKYHCYLQLHLPVDSLRFNGHFPGGPGLAGTRMSPFWALLKQDDGDGGDSWSCKTCKAPVKMSPPTNQHPVFTGRMPFLYVGEDTLATSCTAVIWHMPSAVTYEVVNYCCPQVV